MATITMAIVAPILGKLGEQLDRLRRRIDPDAADALPPHIPIAGPFRAEPSFLPLEQHCWQAGHETAPFEVAIGPLTIDDQGTVRAELASGRERLATLRQRLLTGKYAPPAVDVPYEAHAVVATFRRPEDISAARATIADVDTSVPFLVERFDLMAQYPDGAWYLRDFYTLDRAVTNA